MHPHFHPSPFVNDHDQLLMMTLHRRGTLAPSIEVWAFGHGVEVFLMSDDGDTADRIR